MNAYNNDIDKFVYRFFSAHLNSALAIHIKNAPCQFNLSKAECTEATLDEAVFKYASNVIVLDDTLKFDAIFSGTVQVKYPSRRDGATEKTMQKRFRVKCEAVVEDCVKNFVIRSIEPYVKSKQKNASNRPTNNLIPIISRDDLDDEAAAFLARYYPDALEKPMPVPIDSIIRGELGLDIIRNKRLSTDFSVFGQICFSCGSVEVFCVKDDAPQEIPVKRGTILIDACTPFLRSIGCVKYTLAHEAYHWFRHRVYAAIRALLHGEAAIAYRCSTAAAVNTDTPRQELHWIEWQANKIAPRILMPRNTAIIKINELLAKYGFFEKSAEQDIIMECVINRLADFYRVSKQAAKIRMIDLGFDAAKRVYNYENALPQNTRIINLEAAVHEYTSNPDFKALIDSERFIYADEHFVINHERYVIKHDDGRRTLTEYAKENPHECTLSFATRRVYVSESSTDAVNTGILRHENTTEKKSHHYEQSEENISVVLQSDEISKMQEAFSKQCIDRRVDKKPFWSLAYGIMQARKWNSSIFTERTLLNQSIYSRIKNGQLSKPDIRTVMAICVGLDLDYFRATELLASAGHVLTSTDEDEAYFYILNNCRGEPIQKRNKFLTSLGILALGVKPRKAT
ncbi:MAG: helix-turn-helix transcriptional regulator [Defluviitaleaceae bacterium]|nr:helix-turn-helix transcriptional regulator [Defluviitaleaceae bacterium]